MFCFPLSSVVFLVWCESFGTGAVFVFENGNVVRVVLCRLDCSRGVCLFFLLFRREEKML